MELGTYMDGRTLTYDEGTGTFAIGAAPVSAEDVRRYSAAGQIRWATPDIEAWFHRSFPPAKKKNGAVIAIIVIAAIFMLVFICGILVAIAIPVFNAAKINALTKSCYANERTIEGAAQTHLAENGTLPDSIETLVPTFIAETPVCPADGEYTWDSSTGVVTCSEHGHY